ncbi:ABC transporter ATP-binding protein [Virgisporangium ochraceum]
MEVLLRDVSKVFPGGTVAVDTVSLHVRPGELVVLLGPSGCGKTTLLRMVAGLELPTAGQVTLDGRPARTVAYSGRDVAMVFQELALYRHMSVAENIGFPLRWAGFDDAARHEKVLEVASALGIGELLGRRPSQLSGGQRQRVAMGRALVRNPRLFLMDEPLSDLDTQLRTELRTEIVDLVKDLGATCVYVTHDQTEALTMADRVAILRRGVLQDLGKPTDVYTRPATLYVAGFLGQPRMNLIEATVVVSLDQHVALRMGAQELRLPWLHMQARMLARYHGERIAVGFRPEALTPVPPDTTDNVLHGRVLYLEHHGHESLAFLDVGATAVTIDETGYGDPGTNRGRSRGVRGMLARLSGRGGRPAAASEEKAVERAGAGRHERARAELTIRLAPYPSIGVGHPVALAVDVTRLHFFDDAGMRIDLARR